MDWLTPERYATELAAQAELLVTAALRQSTEAIVPTCPDWTVRDLVTHVGTGHRFAARNLEARVTDGPVAYEMVPAPADPAGWPAWLAAGTSRLTALVDEIGFAGTIWTWAPEHQVAGFWLRRMVHDEIIHRFDAGADDDLATDLAADGIDDLLLTFPMFRTLKGDGETLRLTAPDVARSWHIRLIPTGFESTEAGPGALADVVITAPAAELLLILNRRREPADVEGDRDLYARFREMTRF